MDYESILSEQEMQIIQEAFEEIIKLKELFKEKPTGIDKHQLVSLGSKKRYDLMAPVLASRTELMWSVFNKANTCYGALKGAMNERNSTHEFITEQALALLNCSDHKTRSALKAACIEPDKQNEMCALVYEGHFYGKVKGGAYGNFLKKCFEPGFLALINIVNDIDETAVSNFARHYKAARKTQTPNMDALGWAAHYLQDLTAPHHVGNMAIFFELFTDNTASHFAFEKYARNYVFSNNGSFQGEAVKLFKVLQSVFDSRRPEKFAKEIYARAAGNIEMIKKMDQWEKVVKDAIPLAIAATAVILAESV